MTKKTCICNHKIKKYLLSAILGLLIFSSCQQAYRHRDIRAADNRGRSVDLSVIIMIHGDAGYLYHDQEGKKQEADQRILGRAIKVAGQLDNAEVFIYHQKRLEKFLFFFKKKDGDFYYFRNGRFYIKKAYSRAKSVKQLSAESQLYHQYRSVTPAGKRLFFYYGHQIPDVQNEPYHASYANLDYSIDDFGRGLESFAVNSKFDLLVMSTCYSASVPHLKKLIAYSRFLIASPENLHLSYMDIEPLTEFSRFADVYEFATYFAKSVYHSLANTSRTVVSIGLYESEKLVPALSHMKDYGTARFSHSPEYVDCFDLYSADSLMNMPGVEVLYKPPQFGPNKLKRSHSGLECLKQR